MNADDDARDPTASHAAYARLGRIRLPEARLIHHHRTLIIHIFILGRCVINLTC